MEKPQRISDLKDDVLMKIEVSEQFSERDERLVWQQFIEGDNQSLIFIYRKYVHLLFRYGQQFTKRYELVQDCIQELFCQLIDKRHSLSPARSIKGYLFSSLKRKIVRSLRKEGKQILENEGFNFLFIEAPPSISSNLKEEDFAIIYQKINQLPSSQREVIFLYFYESLSYSEIAEIMNIKIATARTLTYRALDNLEKNLGPHLGSLYLIYLTFCL